MRHFLTAAGADAIPAGSGAPAAGPATLAATASTHSPTGSGSLTSGSCSISSWHRSYLLIFDDPVKTMFSRRDAETAEKKYINFKKLSLRALRLCVSPAVAGLTF